MGRGRGLRKSKKEMPKSGSEIVPIRVLKRTASSNSDLVQANLARSEVFQEAKRTKGKLTPEDLDILKEEIEEELGHSIFGGFVSFELTVEGRQEEIEAAVDKAFLSQDKNFAITYSKPLGWLGEKKGQTLITIEGDEKALPEFIQSVEQELRNTTLSAFGDMFSRTISDHR